MKPSQAPTHRKDDFDMAKLQKSLQQRKRNSLSTRHQVAKLSPAEIRSLNNGAATSNVGSQETSNRTSLTSNRRMSNSTPPTPPEHHNQSTYQAQVSRSNSINNLPTPPHSPNLQHRRGSHSSVQSNRHPPHHGSHIHAPIPKSAAQAGFMIHGHSRPSSALAFPNLPMYRGHEVTRTGSKNMLQRPANEIVTNPLSMYSRPRQSLVDSSPDRLRKEEFLEMDPYQAQAMLDADDEHNDPKDTSGDTSTPRVVDTPVSFDAKDAETSKFPTLEPEKVLEPDEPQLVPQASEPISALPGDTNTTPADIEPQQDKEVVDQPTENVTTEAKKPKKRFSLFESRHKEASGNHLKKKKNRRQSVQYTKDNTGLDATNREQADEHDEKDGLLHGQVSDTEGKNDDFPTNPAVRPLSSNSNRPYLQSRSGSQRSMSSDDINSSILTSNANSKKPFSHIAVPHSIPASRAVYGRCACCGKLKRPQGNGSELSPVFENEHLRTNFSFEVERSSKARVQLNSHDKQRSTPIIPMEVREGDDQTGSIRTVQASIAPYHPSMASSSRMSVSETSMSGAVENSEGKRRRRSDSASETRIVRFGSLHSRDEMKGEHAAEDEFIEESTPIVERNGKIEQLPSRPDSRTSYATAESQLPRLPQPFVEASLPPPQAQAQVPDSEYVSAVADPNPNRKSMPRQDVIDVVGWEKGKRVNEPVSPVESSKPYEEIPHNMPAPIAVSELPKRPSDEKKKSRVSGILKALQPRPKSVATTLSEEEDLPKKEKRRMSMNEGALDLILAKPELPNKETHARPTGSAVSWTLKLASTARSPFELPSSKNGSTTKLPLPTANPKLPTQTPESRFQQYDAQETKKKGHAPRLSLGWDKDTGGGSIELPTPNLGVHFARSSNTLRDLVWMNGEKTSDVERTFENSNGDGDGKLNGVMGSQAQNQSEMDLHRMKVAGESGELGREVKKASGRILVR